MLFLLVSQTSKLTDYGALPVVYNVIFRFVRYSYQYLQRGETFDWYLDNWELLEIDKIVNFQSLMGTA